LVTVMFEVSMITVTLVKSVIMMALVTVKSMMTLVPVLSKMCNRLSYTVMSVKTVTSVWLL
jgi:hypothetical protein